MHLSFFAGLLASFLPAQLRPRFIRDHAEDLRTPAILTGAGQMLGCMVLLIVRYPTFVHAQQAAVSEEAKLRAMEQGGESAVMGLGIIFLFAYVLQPLSLALVYFAAEGAVRALAAFIHNEPVGTLPLYLFVIGQRKAKEEYKEYQLGPRVVDSVSLPPDGETGYDLLVASCRPKDWTASLTISYGAQLYELVRSIESQPPRRFVYLLRKAPASKVVRGLRHYDPEEVLKAEEELVAR